MAVSIQMDWCEAHYFACFHMSLLGRILKGMLFWIQIYTQFSPINEFAGLCYDSLGSALHMSTILLVVKRPPGNPEPWVPKPSLNVPSGRREDRSQGTLTDIKCRYAKNGSIRFHLISKVWKLSSGVLAV